MNILIVMIITMGLITNEEETEIGCCLVPSLGCLIGIHSLKADMRKEPVAGLSFWQRLKIGVGYSGGVCGVGEDLMPAASSFFIDIFQLFYFLNSIDATIGYQVDRNHEIEFGLEYGWAHLANKGGLVMWSKDWEITTGKWWLSRYSLTLKKIPGISVGPFHLGLEFNYAEAKTVESRYEMINGNWMLIDTSTVIRRCLGWGALLRWEKRIAINQNLLISPFGLFRASAAEEYYNSAKWPKKWEHRLSLEFTGIYVGLSIFLRPGY
ncbi:hypothetical protein DRP53_01745 [candidate division WOR-3 bacterium]|uniref:Outer membrane protein beta-barrel domain-containing protein n=1 Tax=candidate division WOR-3 bacterium TaxID=2052148 RepID=A0A660SKS9_UNCW3|nr:MAG: hypothetical protein DRP53_01745 [candidate division WOR-3 bacterium]